MTAAAPTRRQTEMKGVIPPLTPLQRAAETFILAEAEANNLKTRAKKRWDEMVALATKMGEDFVKVRDDEGYLHTFAFETKAAVRHSKLLDVQIVKHDEKEKHDGKKAAAGDKD